MAYKRPFQRTRNLFDPDSKTPFRLSRSRLEGFINCPRCFYLDRRLGIEPPAIPAFTLNSAVDELLKKEFDGYRARQEPHPLMTAFKVDAVPFAHPLIDEWRENFKGVQHHHVKSNFIITGAVDDIWVDKGGLLYVVDYKSTSTNERITLDSEYRQAYLRQMEIYQWLLRRCGFNVSTRGYFVYCNAQKSRPIFDSRLDFDIEIIPYDGNDGWVEVAIQKARECLMSPDIPGITPECEYCQYLKIGAGAEQTSTRRTAIQTELF